MADRVGQQLGNYRLIRLLGRGGFAEVYLGEHLRLKNQVAVKILHSSLEDDDVEGFLREAQTVARLKHPHIVRVFDFDVENHTPYLVMDYLPNGNIRRSYPKGSSLPLATIVSYVKQIASAIQYAHDQKLIHRDIKPENMLLDRDNTIVLSDFGIALMAQSSRSQSTQEVAGTAAYMAPEQFQGHPHRASDQYALGVVVYEWLTGERPFHGSFSEIASQHLFVPPPPLRGKVPNIFSEIEQIVLTALEKDPHRRFGNVQAFATALEEASRAGQLTVVKSPTLPQPASPPHPEQATPPAQFSEQRSQSEPRPAASLQPPQPLQFLPSDQSIPITLPVKETRPVATQPTPLSFSGMLATPHPSAPRRRWVGWRVGVASLSLLLVVALLFVLLPYIRNSSQTIVRTNQHGSAATPTPARAPFAAKIIYIASIPYHNANQTGLAISAVQTNTGAVLWHTQWNDESLDGSIDDIGGTIYAATTHFSSTTGFADSGFVHALRASDGSILWSYRVGNSTRGGASVYIANGLVFVGALPDGYDAFYVLRASNGTLLWKYKVDMEDIALPQAVANGIVYTGSYNFRSSSGNVYAFRVSDGTILWKYQMNPDVNGTPRSTVVDNGVVYIASPTSYNRFQYPYDPSKDLQNTNSTVYALRASDGSLLWKYQIDKDSSFLSLESIGGTLYAISGSQKNTNSAVHALSEKDGALIWKYQVHVDGKYGASPTTLIADGIVYIASQGSTATMYALSAKNGGVLWTHDLNGGYDPNIVVAYGVAYIGIGTESRSQDHVDAVRVSDGSLLWNYHIDDSAYTPTLLATGTALYLGSYNYQKTCAIFALRVSNGSLLWHFPMSPVTSVIAATD